jgi:hypothetical protein
MERRFNKQERYRTDLKKLNFPTWHGYLMSVGVKPATYRKWKSRHAEKQAKPFIVPDINIVADELRRDIESTSRKGTLNAVVEARAHLHPPIRKSLITALKNASNDMHEAAKQLSEVNEIPSNGKCHQRLRREAMALLPEPDLEEKRRLAADFKNATVKEISFQEAKSVILSNEYLGSIPGGIRFSVGLFFGPYLAGVECFGATAGSNVAASICGDTYKDRVLTIVRGAMKHWAPKNAGSHLLSNACDLMAAKGFNIICAFADPAANEVGTLYSAVNFLYTGMTQPTEQYMDPSGKVHDARQVSGLARDRKGGGLRYVRTRAEQKQLLLKQGCKFSVGNAKHRFVLFCGSTTLKRRLRKALKWTTSPYPKRELAAA